LPWNNAFCERAIEVGRPQTPFDETAEFTIVAPDRTLLENLIPGGRKSVATTASSPGVDAQEPVSDDEFESFGAVDVRTVKRLSASRCEPDHSQTNMSGIGFLSIRQHEDSLHR
jgi:hypothetical protein